MSEEEVDGRASHGHHGLMIVKLSLGGVGEDIVNDGVIGGVGLGEAEQLLEHPRRDLRLKGYGTLGKSREGDDQCRRPQRVIRAGTHRGNSKLNEDVKHGTVYGSLVQNVFVEQSLRRCIRMVGEDGDDPHGERDPVFRRYHRGSKSVDQQTDRLECLDNDAVVDLTPAQA